MFEIFIIREKEHFWKLWVYGIILVILFFIVGFTTHNAIYGSNQCLGISNRVVPKSVQWHAKNTYYDSLIGGHYYNLSNDKHEGLVVFCELK